MSDLHLGVHETMLCSPGGCGKMAPGHVLRPLQARVAAATPSKWQDGIVTRVSANGWITITVMATGGVEWVWNHDDLSSSIRVGTPVALHGVYGTLAVGSERVSVLVAPAVPEADLPFTPSI